MSNYHNRIYLGLKSLFITFAFCSMTPAVAEDSSQQVLSVVIGDWNQDKQADSAILVKAADNTVDLYVYLANANKKQELSVFKTDIVWFNQMVTPPHLSRNERESLLIHSNNDTVGRHRWEQVLTVAYRDNAFKVVGYTYKSHDTLNHDASFDCDANLLTGKGFKNQRSFTFHIANVSLKDWSDEKIPEVCQP